MADAKKTPKLPDPEESMSLLRPLRTKERELLKHEEMVKAKLTEVRQSLKLIRQQISATIDGETEENLFTGIPMAAKNTESAKAPAPKNWEKQKLCDLPGVTVKDAEALAKIELGTVGEWEKAVGTDGTLPDGLTKAAGDRIEKAVQKFLSGQTVPAQTTAE